MSLFSRFFGKKDADDLADGPLEANPDIKRRLSLQVLFPDAFKLDSDQLAGELRSYHGWKSEARGAIAREIGREGKVLGLLGWGQHVIQLVGFDVPYPASALEA